MPEIRQHYWECDFCRKRIDKEHEVITVQYRVMRGDMTPHWPDLRSGRYWTLCEYCGERLAINFRIMKEPTQ